MKAFCLSSNRATLATTPKLLECLMVVPEAQAEAYLSAGHHQVLGALGATMAGQVNLALDNAEGEWVVLLDDDLIQFRADDRPLASLQAIRCLPSLATRTRSTIAGMLRIPTPLDTGFSFNKPMTQCLAFAPDFPYRVNPAVHGHWWMDLIFQCLANGKRTVRDNTITRIFTNPPEVPSVNEDKPRWQKEFNYLTKTYPLSILWFAQGW